MGPLVFGGVSYAAGGNQRLGILAVGSFFVISFALLSGLRPQIAESWPLGRIAHTQS